MPAQNTKNYIQDTCSGFRKVTDYLRGAADNVENHTTKERIEEQLSNAQKCLNECENIMNSLK